MTGMLQRHFGAAGTAGRVMTKDPIIAGLSGLEFRMSLYKTLSQVYLTMQSTLIFIGFYIFWRISSYLD